MTRKLIHAFTEGVGGEVEPWLPAIIHDVLEYALHTHGYFPDTLTAETTRDEKSGVEFIAWTAQAESGYWSLGATFWADTVPT